MSVTCTLHVRDLDLTSAKVTLGRVQATFRMTFVVRTSAASTVVEVTEQLLTLLPWNLSAYGSEFAILDTFEVHPEDPKSPTIFVGTATYQKSDFQSWATVVEFGSNKYDQVIWKGLDEEDKEIAVLNSVGDRFLDPLIETVHRSVIKISKAYPLADYSPGDFQAFLNSVNLNSIRIADVNIPPRGAWMFEATPIIQVFSQVEYAWRFNMEIEVKGNDETYDREILDAGMYYLEVLDSSPAENDPSLVQKDGVWYRRVRANTQDPETGKVEPSQEPILLDGAGGRLTDVTPGNEKYIKVKTKPEMEWEDLGLPSTMGEVLFVG